MISEGRWSAQAEPNLKFAHLESNVWFRLLIFCHQKILTASSDLFLRSVKSFRIWIRIRRYVLIRNSRCAAKNLKQGFFAIKLEKIQKIVVLKYFFFLLEICIVHLKASANINHLVKFMYCGYSLGKQIGKICPFSDKTKYNRTPRSIHVQYRPTSEYWSTIH